MAELTARDIMTENVVTVSKDSSIEDLSEVLLKNKISGVPVIDGDGKIAGIVTEADIIVQDTDLHFPRYFKLLDGIIYLDSLNRFRDSLKKHLATKVEDIMVTKVQTISPDTTISDIAVLMLICPAAQDDEEVVRSDLLAKRLQRHSASEIAL